MSVTNNYNPGAVSSINGKTGAVTLRASDVGAAAYVGWTIGTYIVPTMGPLIASSNSVTAFTQYELDLVPVDIPFTATCDSIGIYISTAAASGSLSRLGLFTAVIGSFVPYQFHAVTVTLVADYGTVLVDTIGLKTAAINQPVSPGRYWLGQVSTATSGQWMGDGYITGFGLPDGYFGNPPGSVGRIAFTIASTDVTNGFSASYGPVTTTASPFGPRIGLRRAT